MPQMHCAQITSESPPTNGTCTSVREIQTRGHGSVRRVCQLPHTTPYHPRSDGLVERFNRTLLAMLAMFVSREHDNWDDLLPFMMLAYNTTVHMSTGFTPYRLVFGEECSLPGNVVHRELRPDPPPCDVGDYASWVRQKTLYEAYDEVRAQQQRATH